MAPTENKQLVLIYHSLVHLLVERFLAAIRNQGTFRAGDRVAVAVSGGVDSVALLRLLLDARAELGIVLSVAHVNHQLRGAESEEDESFVAGLAGRHELEFQLRRAAVLGRTGIEAKAREARYQFFRALALSRAVTKIATAHTLDDQAETVLLRVFRGTGIRGLSAIHPCIVFENGGEIVRPLLDFRHHELLAYLRDIGQSWREDSSNQQHDFLRNRVRHRLLPAITEEFGDAAVAHLSELAEIARAEEEHWQGHPEVSVESISSADIKALPVSALRTLPLVASRRLIRAWIESNAPEVKISFRVIAEILNLADKEQEKTIVLGDGWHARRVKDTVRLEDDGGDRNLDYECMLTIPGTVRIEELGSCVEGCLIGSSAVPDEFRAALLDPARLPKQVSIRNWRAGDRYWPAHTSSEKKVKELLSDRHATGVEKKLWPVAVAEGLGLIWMRGFAAPAALQAADNAPTALWIRLIES